MKARFQVLTVLLLALVKAGAAEVWTLERSLEYALAHNPDARIAEQRIAAAQAGLEQANSAFWPRAQLQSSYTRTDNPMMSFGNILNQRAFDSSLNFNDVPETDNVNVRGIITAPLYAGGRNVAERRAAKANRKAASFDEAAVRNNLEFEVVRTFHTILKTRQFVRSFEASVRSFETNLIIAQRRLEGGTFLKADVLDVEVRLAQSREELVRALNANRLAERALRNLLGLETNREFAVADAAPAIKPPESNAGERPELSALRERSEAALAKVRGAKSGYKPRLSAFGNVDYDYGTVTRGDGGSYAAGVVAQWDIWDGFSTRSRISEAEANLEAVQEEQRKFQLAIDWEVEQARLNLRAATERLVATEKSISQANESLKLTRDRFEQGLALSNQIIDAESALVAARVRRADAESDERIAVAALRKALALPQVDPPANPN